MAAEQKLEGALRKTASYDSYRRIIQSDFVATIRDFGERSVR